MAIDFPESTQEFHYTVPANYQIAKQFDSMILPGIEPAVMQVIYIEKEDLSNSNPIEPSTPEECIEALIDELTQLTSAGDEESIKEENLRTKAAEIYEQIDKINSSNSKNKINELKSKLQALSALYFSESKIAEFHSFESISESLIKFDSQELDSTLAELKKLGNLNALILTFNKKLFFFFNSNTEKKHQKLFEISEKFNTQVEKIREARIRDFFFTQLEKLNDHFNQTVKVLYVSELNKVQHSLNRLIEKWNIKAISSEETLEAALPSLENKKIVIFTCSYGTGHNITASALKQTLDKAQGKSVIYDLSTGALLGRDRYRKIFNIFGINYNDHPMNSVDIFNEILRNQFYFLVNTKNNIDLFIRKMLDIPGKDGVASAIGILNNSWEKTQIREILLLERPDQILTVYHMDLNPILEVAEELGIPVLHVPTDYDMKFFEVFHRTPPVYPHFKSLVPNYEVEETLTTKFPVTEDQIIQGVGVPLRSEFYEFLTAEEVQAYRVQRKIQDNEKVLYISAGGNGQNLPHPEFLANSKTWNIPLRIELIVGKNREFAAYLQKKLNSVNGNPFLLQGKNPYVTVEIISNPDKSKVGTVEEYFIGANELSKILDISDAALAKAGGLTVAELLFKGIPIIFDQRKNPFSWELFNIERTIEQKMGLSNFSIKTLEADLKNALEIPKEMNLHFYFEHSREILCQTILDQINAAEADAEAFTQRGEFIN